MTDPDDIQHRAYHQPDPDRVEVRETPEGDDGMFSVRMPIASTGEVRNEGDDPLTREEIDGMAEQIDSRSVGVFLDHGQNMDIGGSRYSATGQVGEWAEPEVTEAGDTALLEADARLMDPETLPAATGAVREALAALKAQVERGLSLSSSIGWREDDAYPGGNDLMEASIVGIGADPRTTSDAPAAIAARALTAEGREAFERRLDDLRAVVMGPDESADGSPTRRHLSGQQAEIAQTLVAAYRDAQGDGSVENFEEWLYNVAWHQFDDDQFHATMTALQEWFRDTSPLDEPISERFIPFLEDRTGDGSGDTNTNDMTDDDPESGDDPDDTHESDGVPDAEQFREEMLELQHTQTETLNTLAEAIREDGEDDDDEDDDEEDDDDMDDEQAVDEPGEEQTIDVDGEELTAADVREMREQLSDAEPETPDDDGEGDDETRDEQDESTDSDPLDKYGL